MTVVSFTASEYDIRYTISDMPLTNENFVNATKVTAEMLYQSDSLDPINATDAVSLELGVNYISGARKGDYVTFAIRAIDGANNTAAISNLARVLIVADDTSLTGGEIAGIVIGSILAAFVLLATVYFVVTRTACIGGDGEDSYDLGQSPSTSRRGSMEMKNI